MKYLGMAMVVSGAVLIIIGSGAFDRTEASRGVAIDVAGDQDAFLGVEYPEGRPVNLQSADADAGGCIFFGLICFEYQYNDRDILLLENNTAGKLSADTVTATVDNNDITGGAGLRVEDANNGLRKVVGDFRCPNNAGDQGSRTGTVTVDVQTSGSLEVDLQRQLEVECVPD